MAVTAPINVAFGERDVVVEGDAAVKVIREVCETHRGEGVPLKHGVDRLRKLCAALLVNAARVNP